MRQFDAVAVAVAVCVFACTCAGMRKYLCAIKIHVYIYQLLILRYLHLGGRPGRESACGSCGNT